MNITTTTPYRGYIPYITYSQEDGCFVGSVPELNLHGINFDGTTEEEARRHFEDAIDFYLDVTEKPEIPFAGRLTLQLSPEMHLELSKKAEASGTANLDTWVIQTLKKFVTQRA